MMKMPEIYVDTGEYRDEFYQDVLTILSADDTNDRANEIIDVFDNLPAADVAPVVHGYWINNKCTDTIICSECKKYFPYKTFYCPHCGAKMDGKEEADKTLRELEEKE